VDLLDRRYCKLFCIFLVYFFSFNNKIFFPDGTSFNTKLKAYQNGLDLVLQCIPIMQILCERNNMAEQKKEIIDNELENDNIDHEKMAEQKVIDDEEKLVILLEQRLQFLLRSLTKLFLNKNSIHNKKEYVIYKLYI